MKWQKMNKLFKSSVRVARPVLTASSGTRSSLAAGPSAPTAAAVAAAGSASRVARGDRRGHGRAALLLLRFLDDHRVRRQLHEALSAARTLRRRAGGSGASFGGLGSVVQLAGGTIRQFPWPSV